MCGCAGIVDYDDDDDDDDDVALPRFCAGALEPSTMMMAMMMVTMTCRHADIRTRWNDDADDDEQCDDDDGDALAILMVIKTV